MTALLGCPHHFDCFPHELATEELDGRLSRTCLQAGDILMCDTSSGEVHFFRPASDTKDSPLLALRICRYKTQEVSDSADYWGKSEEEMMHRAFAIAKNLGCEIEREWISTSRFKCILVPVTAVYRDTVH